MRRGCSSASAACAFPKEEGASASGPPEAMCPWISGKVIRPASAWTRAARWPLRAPCSPWSCLAASPGKKRSDAASDLLGHQPVSDARLRQEIPRPCGVGFDLPPQLRHVDVQVVRLLGVRASPHLSEELLAREELACVAGQRREQSILDGREVHLLSLDQDPSLAEVHLKLTGLEHGLVLGALRPLSSTEGGPDAREELADAEGLAEVVVRAGVESSNLGGLLLARGDDYERHARPGAQPPDDLQTIHVRQAEIEDDQIGLTRLGSLKTFLTSRRFDEAVSLSKKRDPKKTPDLRLVLDHEDHRPLMGDPCFLGRCGPGIGRHVRHQGVLSQETRQRARPPGIATTPSAGLTIRQDHTSASDDDRRAGSATGRRGNVSRPWKRLRVFWIDRRHPTQP